MPRISRTTLVLLLAVGCETVEEEVPQVPQVKKSVPATRAADPAARPAIVAFGDSLTAGFGIDLEEAYPAVLQEILDQNGYQYEVVNAGVSGDTSAGGVRRLDWVLEGRNVELLILALGANDGLRGLPSAEMKKNLADIISRAKSRGIRVVLVGFEAPREASDGYVEEYLAVFPELAQEQEVPLVPSFLENVAGVAELNLEDGRHPNARGARVLAENVFRVLEPLLSRPQAVSGP
jgi:acyl-CoA thioesterase-1